MTSRDEILKTIRGHRLQPLPLPELDGPWIRYPDPFAHFQQMVEFVGGRCVRVGTGDEVEPLLRDNPVFRDAARIVSRVPGVPGNVALELIDDPHQLENVDWAVLPAEFGVAENGALWVNDFELKHRAIYFIVQHLALVFPAGQLVHNLHEAYDRLTVGGSSLGLFYRALQRRPTSSSRW